MVGAKNRLKDVTERSKAKVTKFEARRAKLADAALSTLSSLGYARTSLRDIAENTEFSHGVLRYYFDDKLDLIIQCIKQYKAVCVQRYDVATSTAETQDALLEGFLEQLSETLLTESHLHRLWYDLRSQALFEPALRDDVRKIDSDLEQMIWRVVKRYAELGDCSPKLTSSALYALFDGLFQAALAKVVAGEKAGALGLDKELRQLFPVIA
ncbi:TetR/AcrR family transcriptional regulator [Pelagibius sp. Alg239-R121]|uniref:TetR/AcrR family transcriptional regulator n=1 Tax=Pelagibius sp. Alg239-R121 TaxID=2993448 RepID=UPI0024A6B787|nr:TetR/AcrR family transcriptional regulator [Pelagibius sp. Alg239-R121]